MTFSLSTEIVRLIIWHERGAACSLTRVDARACVTPHVLKCIVQQRVVEQRVVEQRVPYTPDSVNRGICTIQGATSPRTADLEDAGAMRRIRLRRRQQPQPSVPCI